MGLTSLAVDVQNKTVANRDALKLMTKCLALYEVRSHVVSASGNCAYLTHLIGRSASQDTRSTICFASINPPGVLHALLPYECMNINPGRLLVSLVDVQIHSDQL